jgi:DNA polymerase elongation subunit (family B)
MVGLEKQEVDFEHCNDETLKEYCKNDVKILILSMQYYRDFIEKYDLGRFALTKSSQSMNAFRHRFMYAKIYIHDELEAKMLERLAYMGGRVECFYIGKIRDDNVITLDINSMYPYLMSTNPVPTKLVCMRENESVDNVALNLKTHLGVARVIVKTDKPIYSIQQNSKIIFPIGEFECFLCTGGLLEALKRGHLKKVLNINYYQGGIIFKDYVDFFYDLRMQAKEDGNTILDGLSKIMMNSLYGKFGARIAKLEINDSESNIEYRRISNYIVETKETFIEYYLFGKRIVETEKVDSPNSFTAISAHITEYGRLMLWDLIEQVGENRVLYCDTDCIKIRQSDIHRVKHEIHPAKLGALKIDKIDKNFEIMGCKSYRSDNVRHIKGVPIHAKEIDKTHYEYMQFGRQLKHMHKNIDMGVIVHNQIKELSGNYDKGIVTCSGAVLPFQL